MTGYSPVGLSFTPFGLQQQMEATTETVLVVEALNRYRSDPCFRAGVNRALEEGGKWFLGNKADWAVGRFAAGALATKGLTMAAGPVAPVGTAAGIALGANAAYGDFSRSVEMQVDRMRALGMTEAQIMSAGLSAIDLVSGLGSALSGSDERVPSVSKPGCP